MQNKSELIQHFNQAREEIRVLLPKINATVEVYPDWTIKEMLAHLSGWDDATILALQTFVAGNPPVITIARGADFYNAQIIAERKDLAFEQIVREWEWVRGELFSLLEQLTDESLAATMISPWGTSLTVMELLQVMITHEEEHAEAIRASLSDPNQLPHTH